MILQDIEDLNKEDYEDVLEFSADESTLKLRYLAALSIIANLANDVDPSLVPDDEKVDLSICKMLMDGHIEIEEINTSIH
jgi:hypothetical protein|tara:strand:+ start:744 stop:983 length:240 start_codon:yes stop_codon:yes gene_type:complete